MSPAPAGQRATLLQQMARHEAEGQAAAARGEITEAARLILKSLDCERRVGGLGPQVLQLIKPRG